MGKKKIRGICSLCLTDRELVSSHVIPKFFFKKLKEEEGHFYMIPSQPSKPERKKQDGHKEHLLCENCDTNILSGYERHTAEIINGHEHNDRKPFKDGPFLVFTDISYRDFKLCILSVLWRMHLSRWEFCREFTLSEESREKIRIMLLTGDPGRFEEFPILATAPLLEGKFFGELMITPEEILCGSHRAYRCLLAGILFIIFDPDGPFEGPIRDWAFQENGILRVIRRNVEEIPFLYKACLDMASACKSRSKS